MLQGLASLARLEVLDVSNNQIRRVQGINSLTGLKDLWLNDNLIESLDGVAEALAGQQASLACIYLSGNPAVQATPGDYKAHLKSLLPNLEQLDADVVS